MKIKGVVLQFEPERALEYSHLSSLSNLADEVENYSIVTFTFLTSGTQTEVTITVSNFPTDVIFKHLSFYWNVAAEMLKCFIEKDLK